MADLESKSEFSPFPALDPQLLRSLKRNPKISVVLSADPDDSALLRSLQYLRGTSKLFKTELIAVAGRSMPSRTLELARKHADAVLQTDKNGWGERMHEGAQKAQGELLLFLSAGNQIPGDWQKIIENRFLAAAQKPVAAAFHIVFDRADFPYDFIAGLANWRALITGIPRCDQSLLVWKDSYFEAGGFPEKAVLENYEFVPNLKKLGEVRIFPEKTVAPSHRYVKAGPLRRWIKDCLTVTLYYLRFPARTLARLYR